MVPKKAYRNQLPIYVMLVDEDSSKAAIYAAKQIDVTKFATVDPRYKNIYAEEVWRGTTVKIE